MKTNSTNESGFSGLPAGMRGTTGTFIYFGFQGDWWCSSEKNSGFAWFYYLSEDSNSAGHYYVDKDYGFSVRCVKN